MKDFSEKNIEKERKFTLYEGYDWKRHRVVLRHDGVLLPSQPKVNVEPEQSRGEGRGGELAGGEGSSPKGRGPDSPSQVVELAVAGRRARQPSDRRPICRRLRVRPASASSSFSPVLILFTSKKVKDTKMANPDHTNPDRPNFPLSVDSEHEATVLHLFTVAQPHMRAFHITWISYFCSFISTFAVAPLLPIIRDNLNLTATEIGNAGIASVSGAVFSRVVMGSACDMFGPRLASSALHLLVSPAVYCFSIINSAASFLVGFSLATFVATQFWMSSMFSTTVVGTANAVSAGWGNFSGGATQIIMPYVFSIILDMGAVRFTAWRIAFFIPALMQTTSAFSIFFLAQDLPDGNFTDLKKSGEKHRDKISRVFRNAVTNYRVWILALTYGYLFQSRIDCRQHYRAVLLR
ncbi:hypothetical protein HYC85_015372 [Camellia sinensis]|uniref:Major facilitator superfamily (MFS) profile domain-containing protein n=1 Tax=Camellia sinensis TaxID=4442 RepID=A0A7J7H080_CAMSI|nr:hypothetical protein HYC85_015372 [Camellia sinensis]